jgi:hypothetical protein
MDDNKEECFGRPDNFGLIDDVYEDGKEKCNFCISETGMFGSIV